MVEFSHSAENSYNTVLVNGKPFFNAPFQDHYIIAQNIYGISKAGGLQLYNFFQDLTGITAPVY